MTAENSAYGGDEMTDGERVGKKRPGWAASTSRFMAGRPAGPSSFELDGELSGYELGRDHAEAAGRVAGDLTLQHVEAIGSIECVMTVGHAWRNPRAAQGREKLSPQVDARQAYG